MLRTVAACLVASNVAVVASAQEHAHCPMATGGEKRAQVAHRHDDATGVPHEGAVHHFLLAKDGGSIRLEVKDASDVEVRDRIRQHLQTVARSFAAGDYSLPMTIHDQVPPGVGVMTRRRGAIEFAYAPSDQGGVVRIRTRDAEALGAIHEFLRFQIADHGTNDPAE